MFYINPLTWAFRAAVLNEFQSPEYEEACISPVAEGEECTKSLGQVRKHNMSYGVLYTYTLFLHFGLSSNVLSSWMVPCLVAWQVVGVVLALFSCLFLPRG